MKNQFYKVLFLGCDATISHTLAKFTQIAAYTATSVISQINIDAFDKITDFTSYRCLESDLNLKKARFETRKYSNFFPHLNIAFNLNVFERITEDYITSKCKTSSSAYSSAGNYIIVTCSSTPKQAVQDIKDIVNCNTSRNNYIHIHCETGNPFDGGAIYCSKGKARSNPIIPYPNSMVNFETGDWSSLEMLGHSTLGAGTLFATLCNIIFFDIFPTFASYFNFSKMDVDSNKDKPNLMKPIKLLKRNKAYKKKGKKKKKKKVDDRFNILIVGLGATGSSLLPDLCQAANLSPNKIRKIALMDGDFSERKNLLNQRILPSEVGEFKVNLLKNRYSKVFKNIDIEAYPEYLYELNEEVLKRIFKLDSVKDGNFIIIGTVDLISSRKVIDTGIRKLNKCKNLIYIDSGNGSIERRGQVVTGYKQYNKTILQPIAGSGIDGGQIRENTEPVETIGSCTRIIKESPQHLSTNDNAARVVFMHLLNILLYNELRTHCTFFDLADMYVNSY